MTAAPQLLRRTPLHERHVASGARLVPFAGWELPIQYEGIRGEHEAVRTHVGVFDVSHMGRVDIAGRDALAAWQRLSSNDVTAIDDAGAQYSVLCRPDGGVLDDLITYRLSSEHLLAVTNAVNHERDLRWMRQHTADLDVSIAGRRDEWAMLAVQGPEARALVSALASGPLPGRMRSATMTVAGCGDVLVGGTGYTGEDGVELIVPAHEAAGIWDAVVSAGARPAGLGARDTLRLEACLHLYGNDLDEQHGPIEAGLGWCCREDTGFIGSDAVREARRDVPRERLVPFVITGPGIARPGDRVLGGGMVTSGTHSPSLGVGIGMAYLPADVTHPGTGFAIDVRGKTRTAEVRPRPLYVRPEQPVA